jgi:DNA-binding LacI/PurR family transcriptional regulator
VKRITIEDVAAQCGVSPTTVSHVFSGHRPVNAATRRRVEQVARQLGYRPNAVAQSLRSRRTQTIMIVVPDITNPFYPDFTRGVEDVMGPAGYHSVFCNTDARRAEELAMLDVALSRRLDGVIFRGFRVGTGALAPLTKAGIAVVNLGESPARSQIDSVRFDDRRAAAEVTRFLLERYGPAIALIDGDDDAPVGRERRDGFEDACGEFGLAPDESRVVLADFTRGGGIDGMRRLLDRSEHPRAVLCANDLIALGAVDVVKERGLRIPHDIAIAGYDDIDAATIVTPRLTTVRTQARRLGAEAGRLILSRLVGEYQGTARHIVIPHELVIRESA